VRSRSQRPSADTAVQAAASTSAGRKARGLFGLVCLCVVGLAAFLGSGAPSAGAAQIFPGQEFLPDNRAWEMASPPSKNGGYAIPRTRRSQAAADCATECAIVFSSLAGFADAQGTGVAVDYMAVRDPEAGENGWAVHAITPKQDPLTFDAIAGGEAESMYPGEFSPDLSSAVFRAFSPLTEDPYVSGQISLYSRQDLRTPGPGSYRLDSSCAVCQATETPMPNWDGSGASKPYLAGQSADFEHVIFESTQNFTGEGQGTIKLFQSDGGAVRLVGQVPPGVSTSCGGAGDPACILPEAGGSGGVAGSSIAGLGGSRGMINSRVISADGSRVNFSAPATSGGTIVGAETESGRSHLYQRDSHGTLSTADDTTVKISASEREAPIVSGGAIPGTNNVYQTASADGRRIFFEAEFPLTDGTFGEPGERHLYMWRADSLNDEVQKLTVSAASGQFELLLGAEETTSLPYNAAAEEVESAIEALPSISGPGGDVTVTGGPGDVAGSSPYVITFGGGVSEEDLPTMTADRSGLAGPVSAAIATNEIVVQGSGTYTLTFNGQTTAPLDVEVSASEMEAALNGLSSIGGAGGSVTVTGGLFPGSNGVEPYEIHFGGTLAGEDAGDISVDDSGLTEGAVFHAGDLTVTAGAGTYTLTFGGQTTAPIAFDASASEVSSALNALSSIGGAGGSVQVAGGPPFSERYRLVFGDALAGEVPSNITTNASGLLGGAAIVSPQVKGGGRLTLIDVDREPADGTGSTRGVFGPSEDGSRIYFVSASQLVAGEPALESARRLGVYLWDEGKITYIGSFAPLPHERIGANDTLAGVGPGRPWDFGAPSTRVSPDGRHLLFAATNGSGFPTDEFPGGYDHDGGACGPGGNAPCAELYVYHADSDELQCASCNPSGATATVDVETEVSDPVQGATLPRRHSNSPLTDNGRYVFFTSAERLVAEDRNGKKDAYRYDTQAGEVSLLSSGESDQNSYFIDASANGSDAFIATTEPLSGWDVDNAFDIYDARIGGGLPEPVPAPPSCVGDACQPPPLTLNDPTPNSSSFRGAGNPKSSRAASRCARNQRRVKSRGGKTRCVTKKRKQQKRNANTDRRAGR
jgi:hypothetical protein